MNSNFWTFNEIRFLQKYIQEMGAKNIAIILEKNEQIIKLKTIELELNRNKNHYRRKGQQAWTKEDYFFLMNNLHEDIEIVAQKMGRTKVALWKKCNTLGWKIHKKKNVFILNENYGNENYGNENYGNEIRGFYVPDYWLDEEKNDLIILLNNFDIQEEIIKRNYFVI